MTRSGLVLLLCLSLLTVFSFAQAQPPAPRCPREACEVALKGYKGSATQCHASYSQLIDSSKEIWLVSIGTGSSMEYRAVDAKTGELLPDVDPKNAKKCGPRPFNCPDWVYQPCPAK